MRLAVLSDIHGNAAALEAVLADLKAQGGADRHWILGDLAMSLPRPAETMQRIRQLKADQPETVEVIGGNVDRYLVMGEQRRMRPTNAEEWASFPADRQRREDYSLFSLPKLSWEDGEFIQKCIGRELSLEVPGYGYVIGFHGGPGHDEQNLNPELADHELLDALGDSAGRLAFGGHTHKPMDRALGLWRLVNVGSVGQPLDGDTRASYVIATFEGGDVHIEFRRVEFDVEAVCQDLIDRQHPNAALLAGWLRAAKV